jgi:hypothetical protein
MTIDEASRVVRRALFPGVYEREYPTPGRFDFVLQRRSRIFRSGRYVIAFRRLGGEPIESLSATVRDEIRRLTGALWMIREYGLYLVLCGPREFWQNQTDTVPADRTGAHAVIVQGVLFVDPESGTNHLNGSAWGPLTFGGTRDISQIVIASMEGVK